MATYVYKFRKFIERYDISLQFRNIIIRYKRTGYNMNVMRQTACVVVNPVMVNSFATLFTKLHTERSGLILDEGPDLKLLSWLAPGTLSLVGPTEVQLHGAFPLIQCFSVNLTVEHSSLFYLSVESLFICFLF